MMFSRLCCALALLTAAPAQAAPAQPLAVLVAGDDSLPVFDNAVAALQQRMAAHGAPAAARLSTSRAFSGRPGIQSATLAHVLAAVAAMHPAPGQGCLVFATSHGAHHEGLWLSWADQFLTPTALDRALTAGCGNAPTVVVISSCYSGDFAQAPMTRANRVVLTAARADRSSFGCGAGRTYTVYDECLLAALDRGGTWALAYAAVRRCVRVQERLDGEVPSEPQAWFGAGVSKQAVLF